MRPVLRCLFLAGLWCSSAATATATIRYAISLAEPERHLFRVEMQVPAVKQELVVQLPVWNALYQIRDFAHRIQYVRARAEHDAAARLVKLDKQTWRVAGGGAPATTTLGMVTIEYAIFWDDPGPFSSQLNTNHAFLNLATVLFYVPDRRKEETRLEFRDFPAGWALAAALPRGESSPALRAASYDALVDAPVEISRFEEWRMEVSGARIRVAVHGSEWDRRALEDSLRRIVAYQTGLMREIPFEEFLFIFHFGYGGGGGMEHANSTAIDLGAGSWAAGITAHELFHAWNVKRIRPKSLEPVDYARENWTRALWFAEGVTNTYGSYTLVRTGLWTASQFYDDLAGQIGQLESRPARRWQSAEQASLDAWHEKYPGYRRPDFSISYYNKGQILGVLLDLLIREATDNRRSLDDVLRHLNQEFARKGRFYDDSADIRAAAEKVAGRSFHDFFDRYVAGTEELPCREVLALAGLSLGTRDEQRADLGFAVLRGTGTNSVVGDVTAHSGAESAGIRSGDVLLSVNAQPFPANADRWLRSRRPGEPVRVRIRRGEEEHEVSFALEGRGEARYAISELKDAAEKQRRIRDGVLKGVTE